MSRAFFSDKWYRVSALKLRLRPTTRIEPQRIRGETWYILQDRQSGRLHRVSSAANLLLCLLDGRRTVDEAWRLVGSRLRAQQPTQEETIRLLAHLHAADLLVGETPPDVEELSRRGDRERRRRLLGQLQSPLSIKLPIFDPDRFLSQTIKFVGPLYSWPGFVVWLAIVTAGAVIAAVRWSELVSDIFDRALAPSSLIMALFVFPIVKGVHELGHGWAVKRWGGDVHECGIMLLALFPVPYVDASDAGVFAPKRRRAIVGAAGVMAELAITAFALLLWSTAENGSVRALAFSVILVAGVAAVIFNANPLIRLDGYYILSDLIEIPNLAQRSNRYVGYLAKRYLFGLNESSSPVTAPGERVWFIAYAFAAFAYRTTVTLAIALLLASKMFLLGAALAAWAIVGLILRPLARGAVYLASSAELREHRTRAAVVSCLGAAAVAAAVCFLPLPAATIAEGFVWIPEGTVVRAETDGVIVELRAKDGDPVVAGDPLIVLKNDDLTAHVALLEAELAETNVRLQAAQITDLVSANMYRQQSTHEEAELNVERNRASRLSISSALAGRFAAPNASDLPGRHVKRGDVLAYVIPDGPPTIRALVDQDDVDLVRRRTNRVSVRLLTQPSETYPAVVTASAPAATVTLPSAVLGVAGGGPWVADPTDPEHRRLLQSAFQFEVVAGGLTTSVAAIGARAAVRFDHGSEALGASLARWLRQLFLRRLNV